MQTQHDVTQLLNAWSQGDEAAAEPLWSLIYDELHGVAADYLNRERPGHLLQPSALVSEVYLRLCKAKGASWENRRRFYSCAAQVMRHILADHARRHGRQKHSGAAVHVTLSQLIAHPAVPALNLDVLALDEALELLATLDRRQADWLAIHLYIGWTAEELVENFGCSASTVKRELRLAKAWVRHELGLPRKEERG